ATLAAPVPWRAGFSLIERHLEGLGRTRAALCAVQLRLPAPLSFEGFVDFNRGYRALLDDWGLLVDGRNPIARTNVAPVVGAPAAHRRPRVRDGRARGAPGAPARLSPPARLAGGGAVPPVAPDPVSGPAARLAHTLSGKSGQELERIGVVAEGPAEVDVAV